MVELIKGKEKVGAVMVVGGGVGGVQSALDLAESGYKVYLVEDSPAIGGVMAQLDKTFPTNDCSMCILSPKLVECGRHKNIEILTNTSVTGIKGDAGNFMVTLLKRPRYVDIEKCVACGACTEKCPSKIKDEYNEGLAERKAIYIPYPQAVPLSYLIDPEHCRYFTKGKCRVCEKICQSKAINFEEKEETVEVNVGSVILIPGFSEFSPLAKYHYGYGRFENVVTSIQFERILSASGPYTGNVERPSDKRHPDKIAFIQCVGSRDVKVGNPYCSAVCCMYAIKESIIAREHAPDLDITIFFMDLRAYGKGFDAYYEHAKEQGIHFVRSMVSSVMETEDKDLVLEYVTEDGKVKKEEFDLLVLSVGMEPPPTVKGLADTLGIDLNQYGFCKTSEFAPLAVSRPGIFVAGAFQGPKDIPETVMQASGAAGNSSALLGSVRKSLVEEKEYPPEKPVEGEEPRIGVFVCHCGINIAGVVDVTRVREYAGTLPHVAYVDQNIYTCSQDTQERMKEKIREHNLNRIVVAACTPRTHEPLFQETMKEAGLNRYLFEMANIRDQCSWVHMHEKEEATEKAKNLVKMAVAKAALLRPLKQQSLTLFHEALVVGGGIAGMNAALNLADQGFNVHLIEREKELGGLARRLYYSLNGEEIPAYLSSLMEKVSHNPRIAVYTESEIKKVAGYVGNFKTEISVKEKPVQLEHGVVIIATGAFEYKPEEYLYRKDRRVLTLLDLEGEIVKKSARLKKAKNVVFIQCVGSREEKRPYCSRVCCTQSIKLALQLKELTPEVNIFILYRDIRTYGFREDLYQKARDLGIVFIRYDLEHKPQVDVVKEGTKSALMVSVYDPIVKEQLLIDTDILALAAATLAPKENKELSQFFKVPLTQDGFFLEAHMKLRPVDFATEGVFMCGLAHFPKFIDETIAQAQAAASRATTVLVKDTLLSEGIIATVDRERCSGCMLCVRVCPYEAISFDEKENVAQVNEVLCKGCGNCAACCPSAACFVQNFQDLQIMAEVDALIEEIQLESSELGVTS
jgi:heterodisulfide reductase subunit A